MIQGDQKTNISFLSKPTDCRQLQLAFEFYALSKEQTGALANDIIQAILNLWDNKFIGAWCHDGHHVPPQKLLVDIQAAMEEKLPYSWTAEAFLKSSYVYNKSTFTKMASAMRRNISKELGVSSDYRFFWDTLFPNGRCNDLELLLNVTKLFRENHRYILSNNIFFDSQAFFLVFPYSKNSNNFYGKCWISISSLCLDSSLQVISDRLLSFLKSTSQKYVHINGRVMLQPLTLPVGSSPYMQYFGQFGGDDGSHNAANEEPDEWYDSYYLCGVEWANVISPRARKHLPNIISESARETKVFAEELGHGSMLLRSQKPVDEYDVEDALLLKKLVSPALYPGCSQFSLKRLFDKNANNFSLRSFPRCDWAIVPIFEDEISIVGSLLIFRSNNYIF